MNLYASVACMFLKKFENLTFSHAGKKKKIFFFPERICLECLTCISADRNSGNYKPFEYIVIGIFFYVYISLCACVCIYLKLSFLKKTLNGRQDFDIIFNKIFKKL